MNITLKTLKNLIQSSHLNFLYGSGLSKPYLDTLGNIEYLLTEVSKTELKNQEKNIIVSSLFAKYFRTVMEPCLVENKNNNQDRFNETLNEYVRFLNFINHIIAKREVSLLNKQVNLFTTNIDDFMEQAAEESMVEFNQGFKGCICPKFSEDTFSNIISKTSALYQNNSSIPIFNLFKIHGSINWEKDTDNSNILFDKELKLINNISKILKNISNDIITDINRETTIVNLKDKAQEISSKNNEIIYDKFLEEYSKLVMINPTKRKFSTTVIDYHFYELMRMFSNALERTSTLLIIAGFSFADEHIANITRRAANSNPTLQIIIFAYDEVAKKNIQENLKLTGICNNNIVIISPEDYKLAMKEEMKDSNEFDNLKEFDFKSLNDYVFSKLTTLL